MPGPFTLPESGSSSLRPDIAGRPALEGAVEVANQQDRNARPEPQVRYQLPISGLLMLSAIGILLLGPKVELLHAAADTLGNFRWQALFLCVALGFYMLWKGRKAWALITFALVAISALPILSLYLPASQPPAGKSRIRLLYLNVLMDNHEHDAVLDLIQKENPDILCLVEVNARWEKELIGRLSKYPYRMGPAMGNVICSKIPLKPFDFRHPFFGALWHLASTATCDVDGQPLLICCTHPSSPVNVARLQERDGQIRLMAQPLSKLPPFFHIVIAGDFNATSWCRSMREFVHSTGLRDTRQGFGMQSSWPTWFWPMAICIDHAFVSSGVHVHDRRAGPDVGSDHLPVILDLSFDYHPRGKKPETPAK